MGKSTERRKNFHAIGQIIVESSSDQSSIEPGFKSGRAAVSETICNFAIVCSNFTERIQKLRLYVSHPELELKFSPRELESVGVRAISSQGGYYFMPDFEICREALKKRGINNGKEMCNAMLQDVNVAVRASKFSHLTFKVAISFSATAWI